MPSLTLQQAIDAASDRLQQRKFDEAEQICHEILTQRPDYAPALFLLGRSSQTQNKLAQAIGFYQKACDLGGDGEMFFALAAALRSAGQLDGAIAAYRTVIRLRPDLAEAHNNLGTALHERGLLDEAGAEFQTAIRLRPDFAIAYSNLGNLFRDRGRLDEAVTALETACKLRPDVPEFLSNLGTVLTQRGDVEAAAAACRAAIQLRPGYAKAYTNLGNALREMGRLDEAVAAYRTAAERDPALIEIHSNLGNVLADLGQFDQAMAEYQTVLARRPEDPTARWSRSLLLLLRGELREGWREYEWRRRCRNVASPPMNFPQPLWDPGAPGLNGRSLLIHAEQGLGDTIQFVRYVPMAAQRGDGGKILLLPPRPLRSLLQCVESAQVLDPDQPLPPFDVQIPMLSLPHLFDTTLETIPNQVPYLMPQKDLVKKWGRKLPPRRTGLRVGLAWEGRQIPLHNRKRTVPAELLAPLAAAGGDRVKWISLQKDPSRLPPGLDLLDLMSKVEDFADTAAILANLDLVISIDSAVAHLAGALGQPVWTLLPQSPDWRWLLDRPDSPWYPTMRLFRQESRDRWEDVIRRVAEELAKFTAAHAKPKRPS